MVREGRDRSPALRMRSDVAVRWRMVTVLALAFGAGCIGGSGGEVDASPVVQSTVWAYRFSVESGWQTAERLSSEGLERASWADIGVDDSGNVLAVWKESDSTDEARIMSRRYVVDTGWGAANVVHSAEEESQTELRVAVAATGDAVAVWCAADQVWSSRFVVGSGWDGARPIGDDSAESVSQSRVAIDPGGNAVAIWQQGPAAHSRIWTNRYVANTNWGIATQFPADEDDTAVLPAVALDAAGNAIAVWRQEVAQTSATEIRASRYVVGSGWGAPEPIESGYPATHLSRIAIDAAGNASVAWDNDTTGHNIWINRFAVGTGWGNAEAVVDVEAHLDAFPGLAMDSNGNAFLVWLDIDPQFSPLRISLSSMHYLAASGWGTPQVIAGGGGFVGVDLAANDNGNAMSVWMERIEQQTSVYASRYTTDSTWSAAEPLGTFDDVQLPRLVVAPSGDATLTWTQYTVE